MADPTFQQLIDSMTPEIWQNMRRSVELGRWPDGRPVSSEQRQLCLQAMIAWETRNLPEEQRTGYVPPACHPEEAPPQPVFLRPARVCSTDTGEH